MSVQVTYPGVYIEELPGGTHPISGAPMSITAFVGWAPMGPQDEPTTVTGLSQYQRIFGGLNERSPMSYAVQQYFLNGGATAIIVRVVGSGAESAVISLPTEPGASLQDPDSGMMLQTAKSWDNAEQLAVLIEQPLTGYGPFIELTILDPKTQIAVFGPTRVSLNSLDQKSKNSQLKQDYFIGVQLSAPFKTASSLTAIPSDWMSTWEQGQPIEKEFDTDGKFNDGGLHIEGGTAKQMVRIKEPQGVGPYYTLLVYDNSISPNDPTANKTVINHMISENSGDSNYLIVGSFIPQGADPQGDDPKIILQTNPDISKIQPTLPGAPLKFKKIDTPDPQFKLTAANTGAWGNHLRAHVTAIPGSTTDFSLTVQLTAPPVTGQGNPRVLQSRNFARLSVDSSSPNYVVNLLKDSLVSVTPPTPPAMLPLPFETSGFVVAQDGKDGEPVGDEDIVGGSSGGTKTGLDALDSVPVFNLLCIPPLQFGADVNPDVTYAAAVAYCKKRRAMLLVDAPQTWTSFEDALNGYGSFLSSDSPSHAAAFFPRIMMPDPLKKNHPTEYAPSGAIAGVIASTDADQGPWRAAAGIQAALAGISALSVKLTDDEQGRLNPLGLNCLRTFLNIGPVVYGARTMDGNNMLESQWKYISVRRTALYIEDSLYAGLQYAVFSPNDFRLWAQIRLDVGAFLQELFMGNAFAGRTPAEAYFVQCDADNNPQSQIDEGIVNVIVGFAPLYPAEFIIVQIELMNG